MAVRWQAAGDLTGVVEDGMLATEPGQLTLPIQEDLGFERGETARSAHKKAGCACIPPFRLLKAHQ